MDKKNTIIGLVFLGLALFMMIREGQQRTDYAKEQAIAAAAAQQQQAGESGGESGTAATTQGVGSTLSAFGNAATGTPAQGNAQAQSDGQADAQDSVFSRPAAPQGAALDAQAAALDAQAAEASAEASAQTYTLENDYIRVTFTSRGGAVRGVEFVERTASGKLRYPQTVGSDVPYTFNKGAATPALSLGLPKSGESSEPFTYTPQFELLQKTDTLIQFRYRDPNGGVIVRGYQIEAAGVDDQPYVIAHATLLENSQSHPLSLPALYLNVGSVPPTEGDYMSQYLNFGYYDNDAGKSRFYQLYQMKGFFSLFGAGELQEQAALVKSFVSDGQPQIAWGSIKNQFFATVLTPTNIKASSVFAIPVELVSQVEGGQPEIGGTGALGFNLGELAPGESKVIEANFYCGPKEYLRLAKLLPSDHQDEVMQFGYLASISKMLLWALVGIHNVIVAISPNWAWGWAIIVLTIIIKGLLWPLTQVQVRSSKRMAKIQKPISELREKYKDNPQKLNQEMMKLWKEHKVNPLAGCLPILVQFPIFIGLFFMLRTSSELRFAPFLWVKDLSAPEHLFYWGVNIPFLGEYFNLLPILMGITMFFQMRMTPTPMTDNTQRRIFQMMPFIFLLFCYRFPSGLVIYWTGQNLITIFQQWLTNRRKDDAAPAAPVVAKKVARGKKARA